MNGIQLAWGADDGQYLEPVVRNGTLAVGDILRQNQALILSLHKGELKERPAVGAGISDMLLDHDPIYWRTVIKEQLEMDGQRVGSVKITHTGIQIEATY
ncbi:hypothetical protein [Xylanibacter muris]|uniref:hypothetical protein n=1 Tax=Xylanibacter muris TaxID=2736290 RepID=UPI001C12ED2D|nr:hypothetical protein [Xylanibacter muris]